MSTQQATVKELWRQALSDYREIGLYERLTAAWPYDGNVIRKMTYEHPPTFQPGYVGPQYFAQRRRIVMVGQNPGEGSDSASRTKNSEYRAKLEAYVRGDADFEDLNRLIASHMLWWDVFNGKGIFRESGAGVISLLDADVRPSIYDVCYVNYFPFKTSKNCSPLKSSCFRRHIWRTYVKRMLELLEPTVIIALGVSWAKGNVDLRNLTGSPKAIPVWHPSKRNLARRQQLIDSWESVSEYLHSS